jgi:RND family efflux transporter MFP subunit
MALSRSTLSLLTVLILLSALALGVAYRVRSEEATEASEAEGQVANDSLPDVSAGQQFSTDIPQPVGGAPVVQDTLWITVTAAGQAEAYRSATLAARVEGRVMSVPVRESDGVAGGDRLVQIDSTEYALALSRAESELLASEADYRRRVIFDDESVSDSVRAERDRYARVQSGLAQRQVALEEARLNLAESRVDAPFSGRIADLSVVEGQYVTVGTELLTVVDLDPIKVEVQVLEAEVGYLTPGRRAAVTFAAFPGETFRGQIETINPVVDPETRTARVTLLLSNPGGRIKPGMYARVSLEAQSIPDQILVPRTAILERDRRTMLFVFNPEDDTGPGARGAAEWRYVTTGLENDSLVAIVADPETSMVAPGEVVLVEGHHYLVHDATVRLADEGR